MRAVLTRLFTLDAQNVISYVYVALVSIWVVMVIASILSVRSQNVGTGSKTAWIMAILLLPIFGMIAYCIRCLMKADYPLLQQLGLFGHDRKIKTAK